MNRLLILIILLYIRAKKKFKNNNFGEDIKIISIEIKITLVQKIKSKIYSKLNE